MQNAAGGITKWFSTLDAANQHVFAVLDSAREASIPAELKRSALEFSSLYKGEPEETLSQVAPYLVRLDPKSEFTGWLLTNGWRNSWGIFFVSAASLEELRRHFRHFLLVRDEGRRELYFRFYDPRVLRVFLPTCTGSQAKRFLGPVKAYVIEAEDEKLVTLFSRQGTQTVPVADLNEGSA